MCVSLALARISLKDNYHCVVAVRVNVNKRLQHYPNSCPPIDLDPQKMTEPSTDDVAAVLSALAVFSSATDKPSITRANNWLQDFQHSVNRLLFLPDPSFLL